MRRILYLGLGIWLLAQGLSADLGPRVVDYRIEARLVTATRTVIGHETLTWRNDSIAAVAELPFHLYMNAFLNNRSTFMRGTRGTHRGFKASPEDWGSCRVRSIRVAGGEDLTPTVRFIQPDDGNADDRTVMQVSLSKPVVPGEAVTLDIQFETKLPRVFARAGFHRNFYMAGQWFPKIGVLWNGVWNCHQYHQNSEFFADFGTYHVEITVPESYVVGATGLRVGERRNGDGTKTYIHEQGDIHDFAWTACPDFVEFRERFARPDLGVDTEMILLVHKSHVKQKGRYLRGLKQGLEFYSQNYGPYPYPTVTLVDPAPGGGGAGGMEYPTLFTAGTTAWLPGGVRAPEMVTIHEFGHGYWYGIVGSNEFEEAWLDEGINTYSELKALSTYYNPRQDMVDLGLLKIGDFALQRMQVIASGRYDPVVRNSWDYISGGSYGMNVYSKAGITLLTLENYLGEAVMLRLMKAYYERWKFRHPTTADFIAVAEEVSGQDLSWFFDQFLYSPDKLDYAVCEVKSIEVKDFEGMTLEGKEAGLPQTAAAAKLYRNDVVVGRYGELVFPQELMVVFADGTLVREKWDGKDRWRRFTYFKPVKVVLATVDPENKILLDVNFGNNSRTLKRHRLFPLSWGLKLLFRFQSWVSLLTY